MADKSYKMTVGLSNGSSLDAGRFLAPQGASVLRVDAIYQSFQETIPRTHAYPNSVTLYGGELMVWASGECSRVTTNTLDTITSAKLDNMNLKGLQGEAGGSAYSDRRTIETSGQDATLNAIANTSSNPTCFAVNIVAEGLNTFKLTGNNSSTIYENNLIYLQAMRNPSTGAWNYYLGITYSSGQINLKAGLFVAETNAYLNSNGDSPINISSQCFKY